MTGSRGRYELESPTSTNPVSTNQPQLLKALPPSKQHGKSSSSVQNMNPWATLWIQMTTLSLTSFPPSNLGLLPWNQLARDLLLFVFQPVKQLLRL